MHKIAIPQNIIDRVMERRGTLHCHADLTPRTTRDRGRPAELLHGRGSGLGLRAGRGRDRAGRQSAGGDGARDRRQGVLDLYNTVNEYTQESWSNWFDMMKGNPDQIKRRIRNMAIGSRGHELHPDLVVKP